MCSLGSMSQTEPLRVTPEAFRHALAHWSTGVAVLACRLEDQVYAMTVTSLASVSLTPPLVLVSVGRQSRCHDPIIRAGSWAVSAARPPRRPAFAAPGRAYEAQFVGVAATDAPFSAAPVLDGCLAWLDCQTVALHEAGDHTIVVGEVAHTGPLHSGGDGLGESSVREPLTYYRSSFSDGGRRSVARPQ